MSFKPLFASVATALVLLSTAAPSFADHKVTVYRDRDGDGHYNKKTYETGRHYGHYDNRYYGHRSYYGGSYGGYYGYRPYYYGYGSPSVGVSIYSRPSYYSSSRVYRGYAVGDSLASDVQSSLRRKGYYGGSIDGDIGPGSRAAIRSYQRDHGLAVTGRIDSSLLRSLGIR